MPKSKNKTHPNKHGHFGKRSDNSEHTPPPVSKKIIQDIEKEDAKVSKPKKGAKGKKGTKKTKVSKKSEHLKIDKTSTIKEIQDTLDNANTASETQEVPNKLRRRASDKKDKSEIQSYRARANARGKLEEYLDIMFHELKKIDDLRHLSHLKPTEARVEIKGLIKEVVIFRHLSLTATEVDELARIVGDEVLAYGPIEPLLERDDISDIMINGPNNVYIEVKGQVEKTTIHFMNDQHLNNLCQRIASRVGRHVDESTPICDARLPDGSRVNIVMAPLALDGTMLTIRKFQKERLTINKLVKLKTLDKQCADFLKIISECRINTIISGGTGSGKTTLLNCLTKYFETQERIITCEDAAELQLQQPHVGRLETRPPNLEGVGEITMRDLVKNCLRMRPERIIVGEVRGAEAFDLLQAMNTGHAGSMSTIHANNPREAISRLENMIAMSQLNLSPDAIREQIASSIDLIIQIERLHDGTRKITQISEITGMEGDTVLLQELFKFEFKGEDSFGHVKGELKPTGIRPHCFDKVKKYGREVDLLNILAPI